MFTVSDKYINCRCGLHLSEYQKQDPDNPERLGIIDSKGKFTACHNHTHITRDVNDYMHHHPEHSELRLFILPIEEFNDGWCSHGVDWDEGIEV